MKYDVDPKADTATADTWLLLAVSAIPFLIQLAGTLSPHYGYFIDEFYYIACSKRLAFGYVDHPPLSPWVLALTRPLLGTSLLGLRLPAFLAGSATAWLAGRLAMRLGGGRFAMAAAALLTGLSPVALGLSSFYSMNAFEPLLWTLVVYTLVRLVQTGNSHLWLTVGLLIGLAVENKHTAAAFVLALGLGVVATRARSMLRDGWLWAGVALAVALILPNVVWQIVNGWPSLEFYRAAQELKNVYSPPVRSLLALVVVVNVLAAPFWAVGLWYLISGRADRLAFLGVAAAAILVEYLAAGTSRPDRPFATFPLLFAAGAVWFARVVRGSAARSLVMAAVVTIGLAGVPLAVPLLPPPVLAKYVSAMGLTFQIERGKTSPLPQPLADRTGWESFLADIVRVYGALSPEDQQRALIYAPDYGHAGALELWGPSRGLPRVIASQNSYWHWSRGHTNTEVLIAIRPDPSVLRRLFRDVRQVGWIDCDYCMSWRSHMPIYVARGALVPIESIWAAAKDYE
jgi:4-amino-4-deoxy-L-arabinose transferase-like glycosyltransferase